MKSENCQHVDDIKKKVRSSSSVPSTYLTKRHKLLVYSKMAITKGLSVKLGGGGDLKDHLVF